MDWYERVFLAADVVASVCAAASAVLLSAAVVVRYSGARRPTAVATTAWAGLGAVAALALVAVAIALARSVPLVGGPTFPIALAALMVLTAGDRRFWAAATPLVLGCTAIGMVITVASSRSFVGLDDFSNEIEAASYGTRWLIEEGGLLINPTHDGWWLSAFALAVLRYGLPLGLGIACSFQAATRPDITRLERLGLLFILGTVLAAQIGAPLFLLLLTIYNATLGVPLYLAVPAALAALVLFLVLGPGSVTGLMVGGRTVLSYFPGRLRQAYLSGTAVFASFGDVHDVVTGTSKVAGLGAPPRPAGVEEPPRVSLPRWAVGNIRWTTKAALVLLLLFEAWSLYSRVHFEIEAEPIEYEPIEEVRHLDFDVDAVRESGTPGRWIIVGSNDEIVRFDASTGEESRTSIDDATLHLVESGSAPGPLPLLLGDGDGAVVESLSGSGDRRVVERLPQVDPRTVTSFTVDDERAYFVIGRDLLMRGVGGAEQSARTTVPAGSELLGLSPGLVWVREPDESVPTAYSATDLTQVDRDDESDVDPLTLLDDPGSDLISIADDLVRVRNTSYVGRERRGDVVYRTVPKGTVQRLEVGSDAEPVVRHFHFDEVIAVIPRATGTGPGWVVAADDGTTTLDPDWPTTGVLARWHGDWAAST